MNNIYNNAEVMFSFKLSMSKNRLKTKQDKLDFFLDQTLDETSFTKSELVEYFNNGGTILRKEPNKKVVVNGTRWEAYKRLLSESYSNGGKGFSAKAISNLERSSEDIVASIISDDENYKIKGLVIGDVQSGKTTNFTAVINRAIENGYRRVIILSGIHNSLRTQTQLRIEREIGTTNVSEQLDGEKLLKNFLAEGESFNETAIFRGDAINDLNSKNRIREIRGSGNDVLVYIVKKNPSVLKVLASNLRTGENLKTLIIDDEADQASINYRDEDQTRTTINRHITDMIQNLNKVAYIAYTATPFANVFIKEDGTDLYPENFIEILSEPDAYCGFRKYLDNSDNIFEIINGKDDHSDDSMRAAIINHILESVSAMKLGRLNSTSMLIHRSHKTSIHNEDLDFTRELLSSLSKETKNDIIDKCTEKYGIKITNDDIESFIDSVDVAIINSNDDAEGELDSDKNQILIGGNKLSRGITIGNLITTYYNRASRSYDTLTQMARWFGYRGNYFDHISIYTTEEIWNSYLMIYESVEDLKDKVRLHRGEGITIQDFVAEVKSLQGSLDVIEGATPTAKNKMRNVYKIEDISAKIKQMTKFDANHNKENLSITDDFVKSIEFTDNYAQNVDVNKTLEFLKSFKDDKHRSNVKDWYLSLEEKSKHGKLKINVILFTNFKDDATLVFGVDKERVKVKNHDLCIGGHKLKTVSHKVTEPDTLKIRSLVRHTDFSRDIERNEGADVTTLIIYPTLLLDHQTREVYGEYIGLAVKTQGAFAGKKEVYSYRKIK